MSTLSIPWSVTSAEHMARLPGRQVWQAPVFILGAIALTAVVALRPLWRDSEGRQIQRELADAYALLEQPQSDPDEIRALAEAVLDQRCSTEQAARAHYLLGIAHFRIASRANGPLAEQEYRRAREHLEQAESLGVPERDGPHLHFALAKSYYQLEEPPTRVIEQLTSALPTGADNEADGYALLAQMYLSCSPPNIDGALDANMRLLKLPKVPDNLFWTANLQRGELLLEKKDVVGARRSLERVKAPAPLTLLRQAQYLLARSFQEERLWNDAAIQWRALAEHPESPREQSRVYCNLGLCYRELYQPREAAKAWEKALESASGEEEQAAALGLAELRLENDPAAAMQFLQRVVGSINSPEDWNNPLVDRTAAQERFEAIWKIAVQGGHFEQAVQIGQLYVKLGPPGKGHELAARAAGDWALTLDGEEKEKACRLAGTEHEASASAATSDHEKAERLWTSLECYLSGKSSGAVARVLKQLAQTGEMPEKVCEGWYRLAELQLALIPEGVDEGGASVFRERALEAYRQCLNYPGKFQYRARYHVARDSISHGDLDGACVELTKNLALLAVDMDREAHENTTFELADILFQRQDYRQALARLGQALELYNDSTHVYTARYQVAECHRRIAEQAQNSLREAERLPAATQDYYRAQRQDSYRNAYLAYHELTDLLATEIKKDTVGEDEKSLYRVSRFNEAECRYQAGEYRGALEVYRELGFLYPHQVERLHALAGQRRCHFALGEIDKAKATLDEIKRCLVELHDASFEDRISRWSRQKWSDWVEAERRNDGVPPLRIDPRPPVSSRESESGKNEGVK